MATFEILTGSNVIGGGSSYLVYRALLTQTGTNAPIATVLENTLGGTVVWTRIQAGTYLATLSGAFTLGKTFIRPFSDWKGGGTLWLPISNADQPPGILGYYTAYAIDNNSIRTSFYNADFSDIVDMSTVMTISTLFLEIMVYP